MNEKSIEYGWILTKSPWTDFIIDDEYGEYGDDNTTVIEGMEVETHPFNPNYVFASYTMYNYPDHIDALNEPDIGEKIRIILKNRSPKVLIRWGRIDTER